MVPQNEQAIKYFYEALPPGALIPWLEWVKPVGLWLLFIFSFQAVSLCLMVIFRKQWVENERLVYPAGATADGDDRVGRRAPLAVPLARDVGGLCRALRHRRLHRPA